MTRDIATIQAEIAALQAEVKTAEEAEAAARKAAIAATTPGWVWSVDWLNSYTVHVTKRWDDATIAAMDALGASDRFTDWRKPHGMLHIITHDQHIVRTGGGMVILDAADDYGRGDVRKLTDEEFAALRIGEVLPSLYCKSQRW
jgi:hypothetical protein